MFSEKDSIDLENTEISTPGLTEDQKTKIKLNLLQNILFMVKSFGALVAIIDLFLKFAYYDHSRFVGQSIKDIYSFFLGVRPVCLAMIFGYNYLSALYKIGLEFKIKRDKMQEY